METKFAKVLGSRRPDVLNPKRKRAAHCEKFTGMVLPSQSTVGSSIHHFVKRRKLGTPRGKNDGFTFQGAKPLSRYYANFHAMNE